MRAGAGLVLALAAELSAAAGAAPLVAVVFGERSAAKEPEGQHSRALACCQAVEESLQAAGVASLRLTDSEVQAGRLKPFRVAILPCNPVLPEPELAALELYVQDGGKLIVFRTLPDPLAELLGLVRQEQRTALRPGEFATIRFRHEAVQGLPPSVRVGSDDLCRAQPASPQTLALGEWHDSAGRRTGLAAAYVAPHGAYLGHAPTTGDLANQGRMLLALLGHLEPDVWRQVSGVAIERASRLGSLTTLDELARRVEAAPAPARQRRDAERALAKARRLLAAARGEADAARYAEATDAAREARRLAADAVLRSSTERRGELRGAWLPSPLGLKGWSWDQTARRLRQCGLNGVFVKLPPALSPPRQRGNPLAECLRACARHGLQVHAWKAVYDLVGAPADVVRELRGEDRLARRRDGAELLWLCPSDPRNVELERDAVLELARNYKVDGLYLDAGHSPDGEACFCDGCRERFEQAAGLKVANWPANVLEGDAALRERFAQWRQELITRLVRSVAAAARRQRPGLLVSAPFPLAGGDVEEGLLDFACPTDFVSDPAQFGALVAPQVSRAGGKTPLCVGIGTHRIQDPAALVNALEQARRAGADGFVLWVPDAECVEERLSALARSHAAHAAEPPFPAPRAAFGGIPDSRFQIPDPKSAKKPIAICASIEAGGNYPKRVRGASGTLRVETADGVVVEELGRVRSGDAQPARAELRLPPGRYRLAIEGRVSFGWFRGEAFLVRSRPFDVVAER